MRSTRLRPRTRGPASRPNRVFLHIGAPLTGSTYLREGLARHRRRLARLGVLYPTSHVGHDGGQLDAVLDVMGLAQPGRAGTTGAWDRLASAVRDWRRGTAVISHELMCDADDARVARIAGSFGDAEVHVVYTARDLGRQVPLAWQEWVLNGGTVTFSSYLQELARGDRHRLGRVFWRSHDLEAVLRRWSAHVPENRVHLVTVPRAADQDQVLWHRFARAVGLDPGRLGVGDDRGRRLLPLPAVEALRLLNAESGGRTDPHRLHQLAALVAGQAGPAAAVPAEHADWLRERAGRMAAAARDRGYDVHGDVADLLPGPDACAGDDRVKPRAEDVVRAQTRLLAAVHFPKGRGRTLTSRSELATGSEGPAR